MSKLIPAFLGVLVILVVLISPVSVNAAESGGVISTHQDLTPSEYNRITSDQDKFDFVDSIGDFMSSFMNDVFSLLHIMPGWLISIVFTIVGIMLFICALRCIAYILDAIPFV